MKKLLFLLSVIFYPISPMTLQFEDKNIILTDLQGSQLKVISKTIADLANDIGAHEPIPVDKSYMSSATFERLLLPLLPVLISEDNDIQDITKRIEALSTDDLASLMRMAIYMDVTRLQEPIARAITTNLELNNFIDDPNIFEKIGVVKEGNGITRKVSELILRKDMSVLSAKVLNSERGHSRLTGEINTVENGAILSPDGRFLVGQLSIRSIGAFLSGRGNEILVYDIDILSMNDTASFWPLGLQVM